MREREKDKDKVIGKLELNYFNTFNYWGVFCKSLLLQSLL